MVSATPVIDSAEPEGGGLDYRAIWPLIPFVAICSLNRRGSSPPPPRPRSPCRPRRPAPASIGGVEREQVWSGSAICSIRATISPMRGGISHGAHCVTVQLARSCATREISVDWLTWRPISFTEEASSSAAAATMPTLAEGLLGGRRDAGGRSRDVCEAPVRACAACSSSAAASANTIDDGAHRFLESAQQDPPSPCGARTASTASRSCSIRRSASALAARDARKSPDARAMAPTSSRRFMPEIAMSNSPEAEPADIRDRCDAGDGQCPNGRWQARPTARPRCPRVQSSRAWTPCSSQQHRHGRPLRALAIGVIRECGQTFAQLCHEMRFAIDRAQHVKLAFDDIRCREGLGHVDGLAHTSWY